MKIGLARIGIILLFAIAIACADGGDIPEDPDLDRFMETASQCVYIERAYSRDEDMLRQELGDVQLPADLDSLLETLLETHGAEPSLWSRVYSQILEDSQN
jgi:hypothetical protein